MTDEELLQERAVEEVECPYHDNTDDGDPSRKLCGCKGTGKVARFPGLRRECVMRSDVQTCLQSDENGEFLAKDGSRWTRKECPKCHGRGWLPISENVLGNVLLAAISVGKFLDVLEALEADVIKGKVAYTEEGLRLSALRGLRDAVD